MERQAACMRNALFDQVKCLPYRRKDIFRVKLAMFVNFEKLSKVIMQMDFFWTV